MPGSSSSLEQQCHRSQATNAEGRNRYKIGSSFAAIRLPIECKANLLTLKEKEFAAVESEEQDCPARGFRCPDTNRQPSFCWGGLLIEEANQSLDILRCRCQPELLTNKLQSPQPQAARSPIDSSAPQTTPPLSFFVVVPGRTPACGLTPARCRAGSC